MATSKDRNMRAKKRTISLQDAVRMLVESDNESEDVITSNAYDSNELETENEWNEDDTDDCGGISKPGSMSTTSPRIKKENKYIFNTSLC